MKYCVSFTLMLFCTQLFASPVTSLENIQGITFNNAGKLISFNSIQFRSGKVVSLDKPQQYKQRKRLDGKGAYVLPGIIDAHGHVMGLGFNLMQVDVRKSTSADSAGKAVAKFAKKNPDLQWIRGRGWNEVQWSGKTLPTAKDLDRWIKDRPVWLRRVDGHAGWANSKALALAGINKDTQDPNGGQIIRDEKGHPTGILIDNAMALISKQLPKYSALEQQQALHHSSEHLLSIGITSVHDAGIDYTTYQTYRDYAKNKRLPIRIYGMLSAADPNLERMLKQGWITDSQDFLSIRSVKIFSDGALGSRGAALKKPYTDKAEHLGLMLREQADIRSLYALVLKHQFQINIHAIGDRANQIALDEFAYVFQTSGGQELRHRIEHAQVVDLADIPRFKELNIIPSMQPTHATSDKNMAGDRLGNTRLKGAYAWQRFLKQGSRVAAGSDFPVELANPFYGLHAAVTRQDRKNQPEKGWLPSQKMTVPQALRAFTLDAAYSAHQENELGGLTPGKWADFILIDRNIFEIPVEEIWKAKVLATYIAGQERYRKSI